MNKKGINLEISLQICSVIINIINQINLFSQWLY